MKIQQRFDEIKNFLGLYDQVWSQEVINTYPHSLQAYPEQWIHDLKQLNERQLWSLDSHGEQFSLPTGGLKKLITQLRELEVIPEMDCAPPELLPNWAFIDVKGKKNHEINRMLKLIDKCKGSTDINSAVDIGGGVGHLARILSHYKSVTTTTIDTNKQFQDLGKARAAKYPLPENAMQLEFRHHFFDENSKFDPEISKLFNRTDLSIGLHTCGPLSLKHMDMFLLHQNPLMINFGCCYSKLDHLKDVNISSYAQHSPLLLNPFALSLATRGHNRITLDEYRFKRRVKEYRFLLHLFMLEELGYDQFISVGQGKKSLYWSDFSVYAKQKLNELAPGINLDEGLLQKYAQDQSRKALVETLFLANIVRWQFGRVLEIYLLIDRCLYLKEKNIADVQLIRIFEEELSPRNIAIVATKKITYKY